MDRFHRYYVVHAILNSRRLPVRRAAFEDRLECNTSTVRRILSELRNVGAPIEYLPGEGYRYTPNVAFELPGLWFTPAEIETLLVLHDLLQDAERGAIGLTLAPLRVKLAALLKQEGVRPAAIRRRVRFIRIGARHPSVHLTGIVDALVARKRLLIRYHARSTDVESLREVSPQRLVRYRDNWYLDCWCHQSNDLRTFALDRITDTTRRRHAARDVPDAVLDSYFSKSYGIFGGSPTATAVLRFASERARWVAEETWHPDQRGKFLRDGRYELSLPYRDTRELLMDILKYGPAVEVVSPAELRDAVRAELEAGLAHYRGKPDGTRVST